LWHLTLHRYGRARAILPGTSRGRGGTQLHDEFPAALDDYKDLKTSQDPVLIPEPFGRQPGGRAIF